MEYYCPRCESFEIERLRPRYTLAIGIVFIGLGAWLSFFILGIIFLGIGGLFIIVSPFLKGRYYCPRCKKVWKYKANIIEFPENHNDFHQ